MMDVQLLFESDNSLDETDVKRVEQGIDTLRRIAQGAQPQLSVQVTAVADEAQAVLDNAYDPEAPAHDTTAYKMAGIEITNICLDVL